MEAKAYQLAFGEWRELVTDEEVQSIGGESEYTDQGILTPQDKLKRYFKQHIWPSKKGEYLVVG